MALGTAPTRDAGIPETSRTEIEKAKRHSVLGAVDDLDHHRQILGQAKDTRRVQAARTAEADRAAQHGRPRQVQLPRLEDDGLVQRLAPMAVVLSDEDAQQRGVLG